MKSMARRIQRLEERLLPAPETEFSRILRVRLEEGRRRVRQMYGGRTQFDDLPAVTAADASHRPRGVVEILHRGRERVRLQYLQNQARQRAVREGSDDLPVKIETNRNWRARLIELDPMYAELKFAKNVQSSMHYR
jgi:hypothetical protein